MAGRITRRELLKRGAMASATLAVPFIHRRYAHAAGGIDPTAIKKLAASLKGRLILPNDEGYDSARKLWNARYDKHPAIIARCAQTEDVVRAINFARTNDLVVSIRSGGHDSAGFSGNDGGIVIDLASMNAIEVDRERQQASVQPGVRIGQLYDVLGEQGVVTVSGACPSVGVGGVTTGGGGGWISSRYGTASDNVVGAEVVTADGKVISASSGSHPDLFWAVRGGSGNFGVVTRFDFRTFPITHVTKGSLVFPTARCREVLRFYRGFAEAAPEEVSVGVNYGVPGPADQIFVTVCYCGDPAQADAVLKPLRSFAKPLADDIRTVPAHVGLVDEEPPSLANFEGEIVTPDLSDANIEVLSEAIEDSLLTWEVFRFGPAITRGDGAFPYRVPFHDIDYIGYWRDAKGRDAARGWVDKVGRALAPSSKGAYVNSLGFPDQARLAFGQSYERLAGIKGKYDPGNFFHLNQNIRPTV